MIRKFKPLGFSLLEMLLVLVIVSAIIYMALGYFTQRTQSVAIDKTAAQMQEILDAGVAYYLKYNAWPVTASNPITILQTDGYLPLGTFVSPIGAATYSISSTTQLFTVSVTIPTMSSGNQTIIASIIAGKLPFATSSAGMVSASVNIPPQNLNNAPALNFAGLYHHGACIPVPVCPVDATGNTMTPQVFLVPVSVSGVNDAATPTNVYPISSFTAYASSSTTSTAPPLCPGATTPTAVSGNANCNTTNNTYSSDTTAASAYWRACVQIITEKGNVAVTNTSTGTSMWGQYVTLAAFTRCAISGETSGSTFNMFSN